VPLLYWAHGFPGDASQGNIQDIPDAVTFNFEYPWCFRRKAAADVLAGSIGMDLQQITPNHPWFQFLPFCQNVIFALNTDFHNIIFPYKYI